MLSSGLSRRVYLSSGWPLQRGLRYICIRIQKHVHVYANTDYRTYVFMHHVYWDVHTIHTTTFKNEIYPS